MDLPILVHARAQRPTMQLIPKVRYSNKSIYSIYFRSVKLPSHLWSISWY